jgi:hypothetical protein
MFNKYRVFFALMGGIFIIGILIMSEIREPVLAAGTHEHFTVACEQSGVVACRSWRDQMQIDADVFKFDDTIVPGTPAYPVYDAVTDSARIGVAEGYELAQLRYKFPRVSGSVWSQYEMMIDPIMFTEAYEGLEMKMFRWEDSTEIGCADERRLTMNVGYGETHPYVYHRDGCEIPDREVRTRINGKQDSQPGGETSCVYKADTPHPNCFRWAGGVWMRLTYHFDFANQKLHIWAMRFDDGVVKKIVEFNVPGWDSSWGMDVAGAWIHSTSRIHDGWPTNLVQGHVYVRNMLVSTQPISLGNDCVSGCQTIQPTNSLDNTTTAFQSSNIVSQVLERERTRLRIANQALIRRLRGRVLLQVFTDGNAWYIPPTTDRRYFLADGTRAFLLLRQFGLGITDEDLAKIPVGIDDRFNNDDADDDGLSDKLEQGLGTDLVVADSDGDGVNDGTEVRTGSDPLRSSNMIFDQALTKRLDGYIVLQVEKQGQAWYIHQGKRYYMQDGVATFAIMRFLSLGISNEDIAQIPLGD